MNRFPSKQSPHASSDPAPATSADPPIAPTRVTPLEDGSYLLQMDTRSRVYKKLLQAKELMEEELGPLTFDEVIRAALQEAIASLEE